MANPDIPILPGDIRFEDRGGSFVLVDPARPRGGRDVAACWSEGPDRWRWRMNDAAHAGAPYPTATSWQQAIVDMLAEHARDPDVARRLEEQRPRFSFGEPQIVRIGARAA